MGRLTKWRPWWTKLRKQPQSTSCCHISTLFRCVCPLGAFLVLTVCRWQVRQLRGPTRTRRRCRRQAPQLDCCHTTPRANARE